MLEATVAVARKMTLMSGNCNDIVMAIIDAAANQGVCNARGELVIWGDYTPEQKDLLYNAHMENRSSEVSPLN